MGVKSFRFRNCVFKRVGDRNIVLNLDNGDYFSLNDTGAFILESLQHETKIESVLKKFKRKFKIDAVQAENDLNRFLTALTEFGLRQS